MPDARELRNDEIRMVDGTVKRNTWGWKNRPGRQTSVTFYGHQSGHSEGLVAYFRVKLPSPLPHNQAVLLAEQQLPHDFMKISVVKGGERHFKWLEQLGMSRIKQLSPKVRVLRHHNAG